MSTVLSEYREQDPHQELIHLAYAMAVRPDRYHDMMDLLHSRISPDFPEHQSQTGATPVRPFLRHDELETHFSNAHRLLEQANSSDKRPLSVEEQIDADPQPAMLVDPTMQIVFSNQTAQSMFAIKPGTLLTSKSFDDKSFEIFQSALDRLTDQQTSETLQIVSMKTGDDDRLVRFAITRAHTLDGRVVAKLFAINVSWNEAIGQQFVEAFSLSPVEHEVTRTIISGASINDLAKARGRSIETVRTQSKNLLRKLQLKSQLELVCLYSGFARHSIVRDDGAAFIHVPSGHKFENHHFALADGRRLNYMTYGSAHGTPVLYFHGMLGGLSINSAMAHEIRKRNIRLIGIWRPNFAGSSPDYDAKSLPTRFATDTQSLLDELEIQQCPILSQISGSIFAFAAASTMPDRITKLVNVAGAVPLTQKSQMTRMKPIQRLGVFVARHSPHILEFVTRAGIAEVNSSGGARRQLEKLFRHAPDDLEIAEKPEMTEVLLRTRAAILSNGNRGAIQEFTLVASDWSRFVPKHRLPVHYFQGQEDSSFPVATIKEFCNSLNDCTITEYPAIGQMALYKEPAKIFEALVC